MPTVLAGSAGVDMSQLDVRQLFHGTVVSSNATTYVENNAGEVTTFTGVGFTYDASGHPNGGTVTGLEDNYQGQILLQISGASNTVAQWLAWANSADTLGAMQGVLGGNDTLTGSDGADTLAAFSGNDSITGGAGDDMLNGGPGINGAATGNDTISGGPGNDTLGSQAGTNYLRGDDGDDSIIGGSGFDDINGNQGNDTCASGGGDDWVVGGKGNDSLVGSAGQNLVYGNLGNDTCDGGAGNDIVRGGQDNDSLTGGAGDDFVSGDKGDDTVSGGAGADIFHTFGDAGIDRVLDFNLAEGDRVQLDPGTQYTVSQVGADTVINMTGGGQMILVGVQMSSLTGSWIFGA